MIKKMLLLMLFGGLSLPISGCLQLVAKSATDEQMAKAGSIWFRNQTSERVMTALLEELKKEPSVGNLYREGDYVKGRSRNTGTYFAVEIVDREGSSRATVRVENTLSISESDEMVRQSILKLVASLAERMVVAQ